MKCNKCGHENRKGAKHCKECGEPLTAAINLLCPSCGHKNQKEAKFCEDCGAGLTDDAKAKSKPRFAKEKEGAPPPVIVNVREDKKGYFYLLWLLPLLLILLVLCCGGLLLFKVVEVPESVESYINPYIESFEPYLEKICNSYCDSTYQQPPTETFQRQKTKDEDKAEQPVGLCGEEEFDCKAFKELVWEKAPNIPLEVDENGVAYYGPFDEIGLQNCLEEIEIVYQSSDDSSELLKGSPIKVMDSEIDKGDLDKLIVYDQRVYTQEAKYFCNYIKFRDCNALYWHGKNTQKDDCIAPEAEEFPTEEEHEREDIKDEFPTEDEHGEKPDCCEIVDVSNVRYEGTPYVTRYLNFDVECDGDWPVSGANEILGKVWIGGEYNIFWADVTCYRLLNNEKNLLSCESNTSIPQKESWVRAELVFGDCLWTSTRFHTPPMTMPSSPKESGCKNLSSDGVTCLD